jgi:hypothetical protein
MRRYKKVLKDELLDIVCDICGGSCVPEGSGGAGWAEFAVLEANWGYFSRKDGDKLHKEICEKCFDKLVDFMESISVESQLD